MAKRANGEGSIFRIKKGEKKGQWRAVLTVGRDASGRRIRRTKTAGTQASAKALLETMREESAGGLLALTKHPTVAEYLERWLTDTVAPSRGANTEALYRNAAEKHINPQIGGVRLDDLTALHVQAMLGAWRKLAVGSRTQQVGLSTLSRACTVAVQMGLIRANPCAAVSSPTSARKKIDPFTAEEVGAVLEAAKGDPLESLIVVAFTTGMRPGELFGLPWRCVDLEKGRLRVEQQVTIKPVLRNGKRRATAVVGQPKTKRSIRAIDLTPQAVAVLLEHRKATLRDGKAGADLVFTAPEGGLLHRNNFTHRTWRPLLERAGVRKRRPHEARHTFATLALGAGVPVHVVSSVMGHARASITLDVYGHVLQTDQAAARDAIARLLG